MLRHSTTSKKGLHIIIVGCGKVGATLTEQLSMEGHDITLIDKNPERVHALAELYDIMGIVGNGASYSVLMEAGIENTDLLISVTESDELNLLCCTFAKRVADCSTIARVRNPDHPHIRDCSGRERTCTGHICQKGRRPHQDLVRTKGEHRLEQERH